MTPEMVAKMRWLITCADLITPNFTEVCLLLDEPYSPEADLPTLKGWLRRLAENGPKTVVATSVPLADGQASRKPECTSVLAYERMRTVSGAWTVPISRHITPERAMCSPVC